MLRALRLRAMRHGFAALGTLLAFGYGLSLWKPALAVPDEATDRLKSIALSDIALNLRLMALEELKQSGSTSALDALEVIAKEGGLPVQAAACAQLGRAHSTASKARLKGLLEDGNQRAEVRMAAAASIAEHWRDSGDLSYLESECEGNATLSAHCGVLRTRVYGR